MLYSKDESATCFVQKNDWRQTNFFSERRKYTVIQIGEKFIFSTNKNTKWRQEHEKIWLVILNYTFNRSINRFRNQTWLQNLLVVIVHILVGYQTTMYVCVLVSLFWDLSLFFFTWILLNPFLSQIITWLYWRVNIIKENIGKIVYF